MREILKAAGKAIRDMMEYRPPESGSSGLVMVQAMRAHGAAR